MNFKISRAVVALALFVAPFVVADYGCGKKGTAYYTRASRFILTTDSSSGDVAGYSIDGATGAPKLGTLFNYQLGSVQPNSIALDPAVRFAFVGNYGSNSISALSVSTGSPNTPDGRLFPISVRPLYLGTAPTALILDPSGRFLYVASLGANGAGPGYLTQFVVDQKTGVLQPFTLAGPVYYDFYPLGSSPSAMAFAPSGGFLYVANYGSNNISAFSVDQATGMLLEIKGSPFSAGGAAFSVAIDPSGRFLYAANNASSGTVSAFSINQTSGALTAVAGSPFAAGAGPQSAIVEAGGRYLYVANGGANNISAFGIDLTSGALTPVVGSPFVSGGFPVSLAADYAGKTLYAANFSDNNVSAFSIDGSTGALTFLGGPMFATGTGPRALVVGSY